MGSLSFLLRRDERRKLRRIKVRELKNVKENVEKKLPFKRWIWEVTNPQRE